MNDANANASTSELAEVLESETHVDMEKMLSLAEHGVPEHLRAEAWKYMLGVSRPERAEEMSLRKRMESEHKEVERAWRARPNAELQLAVKAEVAPLRAALESGRAARVESLLCCLLHAQGESEVRAGTAHLLWPFVHIYPADVDAYFCFAELMKRLEWALTFDGCKQMTVAFMTLLRHTLPELYLFLEEEQCSGGEWLQSWLQFLLARDLPLPCLLRLWDSYFAYTASHGREATLQLHIYVCLAVLEACNEELMELDDAEVKWYLHHLPTLDMDAIITQAFNIQEDVIASSIL